MGIRRILLGFVLFVFLFYSQGAEGARAMSAASTSGSFIKTRGTHFVLNGKPFYMNGFNAYWLMYMASDPSQREKVTAAFHEASTYGMNVARTWAFSDGGYKALQVKPGSYDEEMFKALDFVISEARKYGVYLILSLSNNWNDFGGKNQYIRWAREQGQYVASEDDFFRNPLVKAYYKNHIKAVLTRINSATGVAYKDDPTIFAWELMNEPRCQSDLSGKTMQDWVTEMAAHVKSIDNNHLLQIGLEGYYGESLPEKKQFNPGYQVGTDFISNNQVPEIDFVTIHAYPDQWLPGSNDETQSAFVMRWLQAHIQDSGAILRKPLLFTEFGKSSRASGFSVNLRDGYFRSIYNIIYASARSGGAGAGAGALFWQLMVPGMENMKDGYEVILPESPSTANIVSQQSQKLANLNKS